MKSFISEDDIEQAFITRLRNDHRWEHIACDPSPEAKDDPGPTGRASVKECILPEVLRAALRRLNPRILDEQLDAVFAELRKDFSGEDMTDVNYRLYNRIRNGIKVKLRVGGKDDFDFVRLMDFGCPANNTFTAVNQMWIRGHYNYRRPDVLLFVNGLPVVFIELKNSTVKVSEAYAKNLVSYRKDIPNVFAFNQICVLSNGLETRLGAFNAGYEFFFEWLKANGEKDEVNREGIAEHGMVVSVDKETAQKMLGKVRHYWTEEQQRLVEERNAATTKRERDELTRRIDWMGKVEMDVVLCDMDEKIVDGKDVEDRFKDPDDNLRLVFVCAMWLTGFDVPSLSTLYLDKPMKSHTLMQAIARVNRVCPGKTCGMVVDYVNVFKFMRQALADYAQGNDAGEFPAKDIGKLVELVEQCVGETEGFLKTLDFDLDEVLRFGDAFETLEAYREVYDRILAHDDTKTRFRVLTNTLMSLYEASKPEIFERGWQNRKFAAIRYLHGIFCNQVDDEKIRRARERMAALLDTSVRAAATNKEREYAIHQGKVIDLSKIDVGEIRKAIRETAYKALEINDLRAFIEKALHDLINRNCTRLWFSERYRGIIDRYNAGGSENEDYYEQLLKLMEDLRKEQGRATESGLTEEELEIFDLLIQGRRLTQKEEQRVKLAAKNLYQKLSAAREELLVVDWFKDEQTKEKVYTVIQEVLNEDLPESYDKPIFDAKTDLLLSHFVDMAVQGYGWVTAAA